MKYLILLFSLWILPSVVCAQDQQCPHLPRWVKHRVEREARWLVNRSLPKRIAKRSQALGFLIKFQQCNWKELLEDGRYSTVYFISDGVALESMFGRYRGIWTTAVVPWDGNANLPYGKMPDANLLEITERKWTLIHRDKDGNRSMLATENY